MIILWRMSLSWSYLVTFNWDTRLITPPSKKLLKIPVTIVQFNMKPLCKKKKKKKKTSNNEWLDPPTNIWLFCITIEHKISCNTFPLMLQKYYQLPILGTFDTSGHFHKKRYCQLHFFSYENYCECNTKLASRLRPVLFTLTNFFLYIHSPLLL